VLLNCFALALARQDRLVHQEGTSGAGEIKIVGFPVKV